ncbi:ATP-binding protein [Novosphingobium cyanobacteriorum]|uniref:histidine kinase n=1 Tax=Novosphingobium cyanobacteriorum TaxID=3024215 RepID=A0ABT6CCQ3_9SPHN|nr:ATP-binding protein [Novosphingobium cyanobacteriorum]MDF8331704.1 ATP-binding protein [Novosphingobium cyanobacteriorum]
MKLRLGPTDWRPFRRFGLTERLLAILLVVVTIDFVVNSVLFDQAGAFALRRDDATRIADNVTLVGRALDRTPPDRRRETAQALSTARFILDWAPTAPLPVTATAKGNALYDQVVGIAPDLARHNLRMETQARRSPQLIDGSIQLTDGSWVRFRTHGSAAWQFDMARLLLPSVLLGVLAWLLFRVTLRPIRDLVRATRRVGSAPPEELQERGPDELRDLIRAFNQMQQRIYRSLQARTQSMLAIGHDLRTPLSRLQLRIENADLDEPTRSALMRDTDEMNHLLRSLQAYVDSGAETIPRERIDLAVMATTLVDTVADEGADATYDGPEHLEVVVRPVAIRRSISNLIENALRYAGNARVRVWEEAGDAIVEVEDDGPGIPESRMGDVLQPFVRLDNARGRSTSGMGLGLPIVRRAIKLEGGVLTLVNRPEGGLRVTIRLHGATGCR